jgi:malate dehydrogenase (oxaloacetate-decarboxylating)(NADP+)
MKTGMARKTIDIDEYREQLAYRQGKGERIRYFFQNKARSSGGTKRAGRLPKAKSRRSSARRIRFRKRALPLRYLIGRESVITEQLKNLGLEYKPEIVDPSKFDKLAEYSKAFYDIRQRKGVMAGDAHKKVLDPNILGTDDGEDGRCGRLRFGFDL